MNKKLYYSPKTKVAEYIDGADRNDQHLVSHIYATKTGPMDPFAPMCVRGWNRSDGTGFSIFRGNVGGAGTCQVCYRRSLLKLPPVKSRYRKTRWI